jgi:hypothetical protein
MLIEHAKGDRIIKQLPSSLQLIFYFMINSTTIKTPLHDTSACYLNMRKVTWKYNKYVSNKKNCLITRTGSMAWSVRKGFCVFVTSFHIKDLNNILLSPPFPQNQESSIASDIWNMKFTYKPVLSKSGLYLLWT